MRPSTIACASGERRYRSTARCSGRAPRSGVNPFSSRKSIAASSHSTVQRRLRSPRRSMAASSSVKRIERMVSRASGRKMTIRSIRLRNSRRKLCAIARSTAPAWKPPVSGTNPRLSPRGRRAPRLLVMMIIAWRKSAVDPEASVKRPSSKSCRKMSQTCGTVFSISSSSTIENGCLRIWWTRAPLSTLGAAPAGRPRIRSSASGPCSSLISRRIIRSGEPKSHSASALAIAVFPVPVGPAKRKTPSGRRASFSPALTSATRSTRQSTASG